ncbi:hypothetical protein MAMC_02100 [Methylacidimicrobium cyclopophantes]|uniref:Uncharacterized protein n=1 Tax=Methylacidimicrobium cyclopophantes TaxID=1041766 RepID=A0A5E6MJ82_9BACT|nr:DUF6607 family protein [Methylacidimicrobium cyclopophantes]VVM08390.1 hypothetical protein MAMC_02100 [Methylacidimicrobium cyclopophantes]
MASLFSSGISLLLFGGAVFSLFGAEGPPGKSLHAGPEPERTPFEADRKAILSMAGDWRVAYRFEEIFSLKPGYSVHPPYKIAGFEKVVVLEDEGGHIALQHLLIDGKGAVTKHWRQDWDYQRRSFWEYVGKDRWKSVDLAPGEVEGSWIQTVWNVDDAPRYAGYGRWRHREGFSEWVSHPLWRPLPRRELSRRSDYDLQRSVMHQLVGGGGWILEEENDKVRRSETGEEVLARELGVISYRKGSGADFTAAESFLQKRSPFWKIVRTAWNRIFEQNREVGYKGKGDGKELAQDLFAAAERFSLGKETEERARGEILELIAKHCFFVARDGSETDSSGRAEH